MHFAFIHAGLGAQAASEPRGVACRIEPDNRLEGRGRLGHVSTLASGITGAARPALRASVSHPDHERIHVRCLQLPAQLVELIEIADRSDA